jgi:hypothetical protein
VLKRPNDIPHRLVAAMQALGNLLWGQALSTQQEDMAAPHGEAQTGFRALEQRLVFFFAQFTDTLE